NSTRRWASTTAERAGVPGGRSPELTLTLAVHGVGAPAGEPQALVHPDRGDVVLIHVEHRLGQAPVAQVTQPGQGQRPAQPGAALAGVHPHDVRLAAGRTGLRRRGDLGPVKAGHDAVPLGEEETRRVEPRLLLA